LSHTAQDVNLLPAIFEGCAALAGSAGRLRSQQQPLAGPALAITRYGRSAQLRRL